jgi:hypothetical protein
LEKTKWQWAWWFVLFARIIRMIKLRRMICACYVAWMGAKRNTYRLLEGEPERKRPLGIPRHRWLDNIMMAIGKIRLVASAWLDWFGSG